MDYENFLIKDFEHWRLYLHENQYYLGRCYIWSKREGLVGLRNVDRAEMEEFFIILRIVESALDDLFQPDLYNEASLGNISNQCHVHVIPRYQELRVFADVTFTDERWGKNYAPYNYNFKIPEAVTMAIRDAIKAQIG